MAFTALNGIKFPASLITTSGRYDASGLQQRWTASDGVVGRIDTWYRTGRFEIRTPKTGTLLNSLTIYADIVHWPHGSNYREIPPRVVLSKVADEATKPNNWIGKGYQSVGTQVTLGPIGTTLGAPYGMPPGARTMSVTITRDGYGNPLQLDTPYYVFIVSGTTEANSWGLLDFNYLFRMKIDADITEYTNVKAPTSITPSDTVIKPGSQITLRWSGHSAGTANPITSFSIDYRENNGIWVNGWKSVSATKTSENITLPGNTRGTYYHFRVRVNSKYNTAVSAATSGKITNNELPTVPANLKLSNNGIVPSTTTNTQVTFTSTDQVWYSKGSSSATKSRITSSTTLTLSSGDNNFYFWGYDGLEYSSSSKHFKVSRNVKPAITNVTVTKDTSENVSDSNYTAVANYPLANKIVFNVTMNKSKGSIETKAKYSSSVSQLNATTNIGNLGANVSVGSSTVSFTRELSKNFSHTLDNFIRPRVRFHDGVEWSDWVEVPYGFYGGSTARALDKWNTLTYTLKPNSNPNHFKSEISATFVPNSIAKVYLSYSTTPTGSPIEIGTSASGASGTIAKSFTTGPTRAGTTYYFWITTQYLSGQKKHSSLGSMMRVPLYVFPPITRTASRSKVLEEPSAIQTLSYAYHNSFNQDYSLLPNEFIVRLVHGYNRRTINVASEDTLNSRVYQIPNSQLYPMTLNAMPEEDPFGIGFNNSAKVYLQVGAKNAFGDWVYADSPSFELDLTFVPKLDLDENYHVKHSYKTIGQNPIWEDSEPSQMMFQGRRYAFDFSTVISRRGTVITYGIYESSSITKLENGILMGSIQRVAETNHQQIENAFDKTAPSFSVNKDSSYWLVISDGKHLINKLLMGSLSFKRWSTVFVRLNELPELNYAEPTRSLVKYTLSDLGADIDALRRASLIFEYSTDHLFEKDLKAITVIEELSLADIGLEPIEIELIEPYRAAEDAITYCRLRLTTWPADGGPYTSGYSGYIPFSKDIYSNAMQIFPDTKTYSYRKGYLGLNTIGDPADSAVFEVIATNERRKITLGRDPEDLKAIEIDLEYLSIDGSVIDGGEW